MPRPMLFGVYAAALFLSAALLFSIELGFGKMLLPVLGGTPSVWNTCLLFYQATLLAGYLYAHLLVRWLPIRNQVLLHGALLLAAAVMLPITVAQDLAAPAHTEPTLWLLGLLIVVLGPVFLLISATAPLLQAWFAGSAHVNSANPYPLYAASNAGSMTAVLAYPFLIEPQLTLREQSGAWTAGYVLLLALIGLAGWLASRHGQPLRTVPRAEPGPAPQAAPTAAPADPERLHLPTTARTRARWLILSLVPASLTLGLTTYLTTDVAAVPLLWVVPLSIYLLSFVLAFARRPPISFAFALWVQLALLALWLVLRVLGLHAPVWLQYGLHALLLFSTAMVCHTKLVHTRPRAAELTEFYMWIAVGGVLGACINVLLAPLLFDRAAEYPLMLAAAAFLRPTAGADAARHRRNDLLVPFAAVALLGAVLLIPPLQFLAARVPWIFLVAALIALVFLESRHSALRLGLLAMGIVVVRMAADDRLDSGAILLRERTFFGSYVIHQAPGSEYRRFVHGTTLHGGQRILDGVPLREPLTYFHRLGPVGQIFTAPDAAGRFTRVGIVGLGVAGLSCYAREGQVWDYFELDPFVERIARDPRYFTFFSDCTPAATVRLGDARQVLAQAPDSLYDILVLDAFTSDALPVHLLTVEAVQLYLRKLSAGGIVVFNISNRHLELEPVIAAIAAAAGVRARVQAWEPLHPVLESYLILPSTFAVLARTEADLAPLEGERWRVPQRRSGVEAWTDDYSNVAAVLRWRSLLGG